MSKPQRCATCQYWHEYRECRRHAPSAQVLVESRGFGLGTGRSTVSVWPRTGSADWCGDWTPETGQ